MEHTFLGKWITDSEFSSLQLRNVFHKQLEKVNLPCEEHRNRHVLFRKKFACDSAGEQAMLYISADDYYKLYINGVFVVQGWHRPLRTVNGNMPGSANTQTTR